ncbi:MAG: glutamate synthase [Lachnospiraceae bacterium]|nr:glutamate synthase [Lachnospiraceae bacterium]
MKVDVTKLGYREVNEKLRECGSECTLTGCLGQRFIAAGMADREITIEGTPGNALGAYLNGADINVCGNAQDAVGDTMNAGRIVVHGNIGDAAGYAMRGGKIFVQGNAGYRAGIHMKAYKEKVPVMVIGGSCGSFLGEYQAGGVIVVLGLTKPGDPERKIVGNFPCTGMHGGKLYLRSNGEGIAFPWQVTAKPAEEEDLAQIREYVKEYCELFGCDEAEVMNAPFTVVTPDSRNPYKQLYVAN